MSPSVPCSSPDTQQLVAKEQEDTGWCSPPVPTTSLPISGAEGGLRVVFDVAFHHTETRRRESGLSLRLPGAVYCGGEGVVSAGGGHWSHHTYSESSPNPQDGAAHVQSRFPHLS